MERKAFQLLHDSESSWWYKGRANVVARVLKRFVAPSNEKICDVGAGYGGMLSVLKPYGSVSAHELDPDARTALRVRGYDEILESPESDRFPQNTYSLIALFDVLEHTPDDALFLRMLHAALKERGAFILTVPAYQFLWSIHDVEHHHYRRYERGKLIQLLERSGFVVRYASYWNILLFIPGALVRLCGKSGSGTLTLPRFLDRLFYMLVQSEALFIPLLRLPFGTGIIIFAEKNKTSENENSEK